MLKVGIVGITGYTGQVNPHSFKTSKVKISGLSTSSIIRGKEVPPSLHLN